MRRSTRCLPALSERSWPWWPATVGAAKPGRSAVARSISVVPSPSATPCQPEPSTIATSCGGAPDHRCTSAAARAASSYGFVETPAVVMEAKTSDVHAGESLRRLSSKADGVPDGLGLEKRQHAAWRGRGGPVAIARIRAQDALDVGDRGPFEIGEESLRRARQIERIDVAVGGEHRRELADAARDQVHDATGNVRGGNHLGEGDRRERPRLTREEHDGVP